MKRIAVFGAVLCSLGVLCQAATPDNETSAGGNCGGQITYASDTDDSYRYLEAEQRNIYEHNPGLADPYSREELKRPNAVKSFSDLKRRALQACPDRTKRAECALDPDMVDAMEQQLRCIVLPTRFESPLFSALISLDSRQLDKVRIPRFPQTMQARFGSLPTGTIDAQAVLPPGGKVPVVILNRDIFLLTGAFSKSISDAIPITMGQSVGLSYSDDAIRQRLKQHPYIVANFADALSRLVRTGTSAGANEVTLDEPHNHLHARLVTAMDQFLMGHEQAHVILNHVSDRAIAFQLAGSRRVPAPLRFHASAASAGAPGPSPTNGASDTTMTVEMRTREQELEADALGFKLMMWSEAAGGDPVSELIAAAAPHMVFRLLDAAGAYGLESGGWTFADANHPSADDRIKTLAPVFDAIAKDEPVLRQADFRIAFDAAFRVLLSEADPVIRRNLGLAAQAPQ